MALLATYDERSHQKIQNTNKNEEDDKSDGLNRRNCSALFVRIYVESEILVTLVWLINSGNSVSVIHKMESIMNDNNVKSIIVFKGISTR